MTLFSGLTVTRKIDTLQWRLDPNKYAFWRSSRSTDRPPFPTLRFSWVKMSNVNGDIILGPISMPAFDVFFHNITLALPMYVQGSYVLSFSLLPLLLRPRDRHASRMPPGAPPRTIYKLPVERRSMLNCFWRQSNNTYMILNDLGSATALCPQRNSCCCSKYWKKLSSSVTRQQLFSLAIETIAILLLLYQTAHMRY